MDLVKSIVQQEYKLPVTDSGLEDLRNIAERYMRDGNFWVANSNDKIVGTCAVHRVGGIAVLRRMFVHPELRGSGVAIELLASAEAWASANHCTAIYLGTVDKLERAQRFYRKLGYTEIQVEKLPPEFPRIAVDNRFFFKRAGSKA